LETLWQRRQDGTLPPFRRIAIETTGLADPAPVAHALLTESGSFACRLDGIVTTVDALHGAAQLQRQPEARQQVAMADRVLLTKTDLASPAEIAATEARITGLNAGAPLRHVMNGDVAAGDVFGLGPGDGADDARIAAWLRPFETAPHHGHRHLAFRHGNEIDSVVLRSDAPVRWPAVQAWLESVLSLRGDAVLRLKGLVRLEGEQRTVVLQGVHHVLHPPVYLDERAEDGGGTRIVLITRGLSAKGLRASFAAAARCHFEERSDEAISAGSAHSMTEAASSFRP
jgi:G3E family GTPase